METQQERPSQEQIKVKLTKLMSSHKNLRTDTVEGVTLSLPVVGERFIMWGEGLEDKEATREVVTTPVLTATPFNNGHLIFETANSVYRVDRIQGE